MKQNTIIILILLAAVAAFVAYKMFEKPVANTQPVLKPKTPAPTTPAAVAAKPPLPQLGNVQTTLNSIVSAASPLINDIIDQFDNSNQTDYEV
jgi:hypothetical protein